MLGLLDRLIFHSTGQYTTASGKMRWLPLYTINKPEFHRGKQQLIDND